MQAPADEDDDHLVAPSNDDDDEVMVVLAVKTPLWHRPWRWLFVPIRSDRDEKLMPVIASQSATNAVVVACLGLAMAGEILIFYF